MKGQIKHKNRSFLGTIGVSIAVVIVLGSRFEIPSRFIIPYVVLALLVYGSIVLWTCANENADGSEWWQDEDASGWRGY